MIRPRAVVPVLCLTLCSAIVPATRVGAQVVCLQPSDCADGDPCTLDACVPDPCTPESCVPPGFCLNTVIPGCRACQADADCADGDPCTSDVCRAGQCRSDPAPDGACDDGDPCTAGDACRDGLCAGTPLECSDGIACTQDACEGGTCVHRPDDSACGAGGDCAAGACRPDVPGTGASGCTVDPTPFDDRECAPDADACSVDRCRAAACTHDLVPDEAQCAPVRPSYRNAVRLRAGVERLLNFVALEGAVGGEAAAPLVAELARLRDDLDASVRALGGLATSAALPSGTRLRLPANPSIAQLRGGLALVWLRGTTGRARKLLGAVSRGRRRGEIDAETARELRRNGRILLADTKALKRDVKNLQKTFSIFQR